MTTTRSLDTFKRIWLPSALEHLNDCVKTKTNLLAKFLKPNVKEFIPFTYQESQIDLYGWFHWSIYLYLIWHNPRSRSCIHYELQHYLTTAYCSGFFPRVPKLLCDFPPKASKSFQPHCSLQDYDWQQLFHINQPWIATYSPIFPINDFTNMSNPTELWNYKHVPSLQRHENYNI